MFTTAVTLLKDWIPVLGLIVLAHPLYLLATAFVMRVCGVPKKRVATWVEKQAGTHRIVELVRAIRARRDA